MGFFESIGGVVNDIFGGTSSAKRSYKDQVRIMEKQHEYNKEYAQNAHQWEVGDLQKAGLNPAIAAGGATGGAIAGSSVGASPGTSSTNGNLAQLIGIGSSLAETISALRTNETNNAKTTAETAGIILNNELIEKYGDREKQEQLANIVQNTALNKAKEEQIRSGKLADVFGTDNARMVYNIIKDVTGLNDKSAKEIAKKIKNNMNGQDIMDILTGRY